MSALKSYCVQNLLPLTYVECSLSNTIPSDNAEKSLSLITVPTSDCAQSLLLVNIAWWACNEFYVIKSLS